MVEGSMAYCDTLKKDREKKHNRKEKGLKCGKHPRGGWRY